MSEEFVVCDRCRLKIHINYALYSLKENVWYCTSCFNAMVKDRLRKIEVEEYG